jgi:tetratricopeptide (TPR) repeat protein
VFAQALFEAGNPETYSYSREIEALERVVREDPNNSGAMDALIDDLLEAGYFQDALGVAERFVDLDPLSPWVRSRMFHALLAVGRTSEALRSRDLFIQLRDQAGTNSTYWTYLVTGQLENGIAYIEAALQREGRSTAWVRELAAGARDPATGQAYLDRRIPQIVASLPEEDAYGARLSLATWYLYFGFLDRYFELIRAVELSSSQYTDADTLVYWGSINRQSGFTAHSQYLDVAEALGIVEVWEQRGPPDFCEKVSGQWVCE